MSEGIKKSVKLLENDSIFDADQNEIVSGMLASEENNGLGQYKNSKWIDFRQMIGRAIEESSLEQIDMLLAYYPLLSITDQERLAILEAEMEKHHQLEVACYGDGVKCRDFKEKLDSRWQHYLFTDSGNVNQQTLRIEPLEHARLLQCNLLDFDAKRFARDILMIEAEAFKSLSPKEFFQPHPNEVITSFIAIFNRLTSVLISSILCAPKASSINFVIKMMREFHFHGGMNGMMACLAALQSITIHRLQHHLPAMRLSRKYRQRLTELSEFATAKNNFMEMRKRACLTPWLGIILRDFCFIREAVMIEDQKVKDFAMAENQKAEDFVMTENQDVKDLNDSKSVKDARSRLMVNVPLAKCLVKILNSMKDARDACDQFLSRQCSSKESREKAARTKEWLMNCPLEIEGEEAQDLRMKEILKSKGP